jgi:hypothetical protein
MKRSTLMLGLAVAASACQQFSPQQAALSSGVAQTEVDWSRRSGANTVTGTAQIKDGNTVHGCESANLIPDSAYARARMTAIFGSTTKGMRPANLAPVKFERDDPLYVSTLRTTRCDASGSFSFPRVPDGVWYVTSSVKWEGASRVEGGSMMQRVEVRGGRLVKVTLP